jgi:hypothetical protein
VKPRHEPSWKEPEVVGNEILIGHVGPLDVYYEDNYYNNEEKWILVVGPRERKLREPYVSTTNFDIYVITDGSRLTPTALKPDIHIELPEMCEIYALAIRLGYMEAVDGAEI